MHSKGRTYERATWCHLAHQLGEYNRMATVLNHPFQCTRRQSIEFSLCDEPAARDLVNHTEETGSISLSDTCLRPLSPRVWRLSQGFRRMNDVNSNVQVKGTILWRKRPKKKGRNYPIIYYISQSIIYYLRWIHERWKYIDLVHWTLRGVGW